MQAISQALNRLLEDGSWFVRAEEVRLFAVRAGDGLRKSVLHVLTGLEFHHDNRSAWVLFEDAHGKKDGGWQARANRLLAHWEDRRKAFLQNEKLEMPEARAPASGAAPPSFPIAAAATLGALRPPLEGLVFLLAPATVEDVEALGGEIEALVKTSPLQRCRWVLVLDAKAPWPSFLERLGPEAMRCDCVPDPAQEKGDLAALASASPDSFGRAAPRGVTPPRRVDAPPPLDVQQRDAALRKAGIDPALLEQSPHLRGLVLGAAVAMKDGDGDGAVRMQSEACELAESLKLPAVAVICRVALASYLSGLGKKEPALEALGEAVDLARRHQLLLEQAQAHLATALLLVLDKKHQEAAREYVESARLAEKANVPLLAIESWRLVGQLALQMKAEPQAIKSFNEAMRVAGGSPTDMVKISSAPEAARKLASLYRERGLPAQEQALLDQADAMERGEVGVTAAAATLPVTPAAPAAARAEGEA